MLNWINNYGSFIGTTVVVAGAIGWYIKLQMKDVKRDICDLKDDIAEVSAETKTNGGSSMRDEIKLIKSHQEEADYLRRQMDKKLDKMYTILLDYVSSKDSK